jgi:Ca2+-binding RTX toxin-like protein
LNNSMTGGSGQDTLNAGSGNDTIDGGAGNDSMIGGLGNDLFVVRDGGDAVLENLGEGADTVNAAFDAYTLAANVENLLFIGAGDFTGAGNTAANTITGGGWATTCSMAPADWTSS